MSPQLVDAAPVREWAWTLEGRDDQVELAWSAARRCCDVWEATTTIANDVRVVPGQLLAKEPDVAVIERRLPTLLAVQHDFAYPDGHGPHSFDHGGDWWGRYRIDFPPYELLDGGPSWLWALASCTNACAAALWTPEAVPAIDDELERQARVEAGPIRATVEACVASFVSKPTERLGDFVAVVTEG